MNPTATTEPEPKTDNETELRDLLKGASGVVSRVFGAPVTLVPMRPAGAPYQYRVTIEGEDGSLRALPGTLSAAAVRTLAESLCALGRAAGLPQ